jgi:hypothetical protein
MRQNSQFPRAYWLAVLRMENLELAIAASAGVAAVSSTPATSPIVATATFGCGVVAAESRIAG